MDNVYVYVVKLPTRVSGFSTPCLDGYTIYINSSLCQEQMQRTYLHELHHIKNGDFDREDVQRIEYEAHKRA